MSALLALLAAAALPARAQTTDQLKREVAAIGVEEKLGAAVPRAATFTDSEGRPVTLAELGDARCSSPSTTPAARASAACSSPACPVRCATSAGAATASACSP